MSDLEAVCSILKGRKVTIRTEIVPAAISIMKKVMDAGLLKIFLDSSCNWLTHVQHAVGHTWEF